jgi:nucleoside-diphosphate-sugar epimerase
MIMTNNLRKGVNRPLVFITGINGFVGSAVRQWLETQGVAVYGADRKVGIIGASTWVLDLQDVNALSTALKQCLPDVIFHLAGAVGTVDEKVLHDAHAGTTYALLQSVHAICPWARVVVLGSAAEYGSHASVLPQILEETLACPDTLYGKEKLAQSELAQALGLELGIEVIRVRLFNTLGMGQGSHLVAGALVKRLQQVFLSGGHVFEVYDPDSERDYLDIRDAARLLWLVASQGKHDPKQWPIQIASGEATRVTDLAMLLLEIAGLTDKVEVKSMQNGAPTRYIGRPTTLQQWLGNVSVRQISVRDSLRDMWQWQIEHNLTGSA